jgi:hypothetical protein
MPTTERLARFSRDPKAAGSFQFTARDLTILSIVAEHRFIRSEWIVTLAGGSRQQVLRRLHLLFHHGYLERPRAQLDYFHRGGSSSIIYGLASRGAGRLRHDLDLPFDRMNWMSKTRPAKRLFLEHTVLISDFMATQHCECQRSKSRLLTENELEKPKGRENSRMPFRWSARQCSGRSVTVVPDKVFAVESAQPDGRVVRQHYLLEADRGTMPVTRSNPRQTSIMRKLLTYTLLSRDSLPQNCSVVILSGSASRLSSIVAAIAAAGLPKRLFKMAHYDDMIIKSPMPTTPH